MVWWVALRGRPSEARVCRSLATRGTDAMAIRPFYEDVQAHYDLSNEFYALFLDESMVYSCAYFERDDMSLYEAQQAKIDLSLSKCDLAPGMLLLDVGCGWGGTVLRAVQKYGVRAIGLTLSKQQFELAQKRAAGHSGVEIRLQGWEEFDEPVDRIVSIGALEHFRFARYAPFFERCREILPDDGCMMIHSIVQGIGPTEQPGSLEYDEEFVAYVKFIGKQIFPGGQVPPREKIVRHATAAGFEVTKQQSLRLHYAKTLDHWAANLQAGKDQTIGLTSQEVYDRYVRYLTQSAHYFRTGHNDVVQFSMSRRRD